MNRLSYPPAQDVAHTVAEHFRHHRELAGIAAEIPDAATIERIINAAFWASLRREEGRAPTISLAYLPPTAAGTALLIERPLALDPTILTKLAPAVERPGIHLGVWREEGELRTERINELWLAAVAGALPSGARRAPSRRSASCSR